MARRPTPYQYRLAAFALVTLCVLLPALGRVDDATMAAGCTVAVGLGR